MVASPRLGFTYLAEGETVPETAVNEIASFLEAAGGHFIFQGFAVDTPPASPAQLDTYWTGASPTGVWSGQPSKIAIYLNTAWAFITAKEGFTAWTVGGGLNGYNGTAWVEPTVGATSATYTDEQAQDAAAAMLAAGTHTNVTVTYDDATNSLSLAASGGGGGGGGLATLDILKKNARFWMPVPGSTTVNAFGMGNVTSGSTSGVTPSTGSFLSIINRLSFQTSSTAGTVAGTTENAPRFIRGDSATPGGFNYQARFGINQLAGTTTRLFVGLYAISSIGNFDPSALVNIIALAADAADANLHIMHNDASGTATKIDLGVNFPKSTGILYELKLYSAHDGASVSYEVNRLGISGGVPAAILTATGTISLDMPAKTQLLYSHMSIGNGGTASAAQLHIASQYADGPSV